MRENREYICFVLCVLLGCWCKIISTYPQSVTESSNKNNSNNKNYNNNNNILALNFNDKSNATAYDDRRNVGVVEIITKAEKIHFSQINENENFSGILENALNAQRQYQNGQTKSETLVSLPIAGNAHSIVNSNNNNNNNDNNDNNNNDVSNNDASINHFYEDSDFMQNNSDDLIFAIHPSTFKLNQRQTNKKSSKVFQQIDLLTSTSATSTPSLSSSLSSSLSLASALATSVLERDSLTTASVTLPTNSTKVDDNVAIDVVDGRPHKIELSTKAFDMMMTTMTTTTTMNSNDNANAPIITPLDLSDFLALIPAQRVHNIIHYYYHNDPEVKRAYSFMSSSEFTRLKEHIIAVPEMSAFLRYLNNSGLDLVKFVNAIANLTNGIDDVSSTSYQNDNNELMANHGVVTKKSDIEFELNLNSSVTLKAYEANKTITSTETGSIFTESSTTGEMVLTTTEEHFSGLHGLVDSVLEALPQDQILATFFDKLETSEEFSKLFDDIGSPPFAKILENMENSMPLRHLIFTLHNNGIYIMKMVDSLKSYFFLGTF